jgi:autotransporter-associated beta strand protein
LTVNPASGSTTFAGVIAGTNSGAQGNIALQKNGAGTLILTGANTYSGTTTVNGGTLTVAGGAGPAAALSSTSGITVNSGGTVLLGASDQINNTATVTLAGGTFAKGNFSEGAANAPGIGALTLTATGSKIDFGAGSVGVLTFASFAPGSFTLTVDNWTGTANTVGSGATDRLIFASDQNANLSNFYFTGYAPGAVEFLLPGGGGYYEVTPAAIPETSTWITAALGFGAAGFHFIRRRRAKAVCA